MKHKKRQRRKGAAAWGSAIHDENLFLTIVNQQVYKRTGMASKKMQKMYDKFKAAEPHNMANLYQSGARFLSPIEVRHALEGTVNLSSWLPNMGFKIQGPLSGQINKYTAADYVMYKGTAGDASRSDQVGTTNKTDYNLEHARADITVDWETMRNAALSHGEDFMRIILANNSRALSNNIADAFINGDTTLANTTAQNKCLRVFDGLLRLGQQNGAYRQSKHDALRGTHMDAQDLALFSSMKRQMPVKYRNAKNAFLLTGAAVDSLAYYHSQFETAKAQEVLQEGEAVLPAGRILGQPYYEIPQMNENEAADIAAANPTAVADNTSYVTVRVHSLLPDTTDYSGRVVRVYLDATPATYEDCYVYRDSSNQNVIDTTGLLGQTAGSVSTTASDYTVQVMGTMPFIYTHPKNVELVMGDRMFSFVKFIPESLEWQFTYHIWLCVVVHDYDGLVIYDNIIPSVNAASYDMAR